MLSSYTLAMRTYDHRSVIWPSQSLGLSRLMEDESFALCTPTGSGKTTVAEVALLQSLFQETSLVAEERR